MRIIFAGTPEFVLPTLESIQNSNHHLVAVYTTPDKPAGRGLKLRNSPVKDLALYHNLPVEQPAQFDNDACNQLMSYQADLMIVMAYGFILPAEVLGIPKLGCVNAHLSLLPRWRGAAPVIRAIEAGDKETGVCLIIMNEKLDEGDVITYKKVAITSTETPMILYKKLSNLTVQIVDELLSNADQLLECAKPQDATLVSYAKKVNKDEAWIDWNQSAEVIDRKIRAFNNWPVAQTKINELCVRVWEAKVCEGVGVAGDILDISHAGIVVACGEQALLLKVVQLQNARQMSASDFANGHSIEGSRFV